MKKLCIHIFFPRFQALNSIAFIRQQHAFYTQKACLLSFKSIAFTLQKHSFHKPRACIS